MRILFLSQEYPPETNWGGIGVYVYCVAPMLAARGHDVHVLSCVRGQVPRDYADRGVMIHRRNQFSVRGLGRLIRSGHELVARFEVPLSCWREAHGLCTEFDVVEAPDWMAEGLFVSFFHRWPVVGHVHGSLDLIRQANHLQSSYSYRLGDLVERTAMRRVDLITCLAPHMVDDLRLTGWLGACPVRILPFPIDVDGWTSVSPIQRTKPTILVVGRIEPHKAQDLVIRAADRLGSRVHDLELIFAGRYRDEPSSYKTKLEQLADEIGIRCHFLGHVSRDALRGWYGQARVVVVSSWYEGVSIAALEGMASGRPVVCTEKVGAAALLRDSGAGAVVPVGDFAALAQAVLPYLRDLDAATEAGGRAREVVGAYSQTDAVGRAYESAYTEAIRSWQRGRSKLPLFIQD